VQVARHIGEAAGLGGRHEDLQVVQSVDLQRIPEKYSRQSMFIFVRRRVKIGKLS
jgi:hypothetical protein